MLSIVQTINAYLSDYILVFLLVAVGLWYTIKLQDTSLIVRQISINC